MSQPVRVGVVGCGLIAQTMHLPVLRDLAEAHIEALCDISPGTVAAVADRLGVEKRYVDHRELAADPRIDAVAVLTYDHHDVVADVIEAGKHVLIEKPLAFTVDEGRALVHLAQRHGVTAMVGYMKLYDPALEFGTQQIRAGGPPRSIHVHDFGGRREALARHDIDVLRVTDLPDQTAERSRKFSSVVEARVASALGESHAGYAGLFVHVLMLGCHDLAVLRTAVGPPDRVAHAQPVSSRRLVAVLEYSGGAPCVFEVGVSELHDWWDEYLAVYSDSQEVRVEFANPFYPYLPTTVRIKETVDGSPSERKVRVSHDYGFRRQWLHFFECCRSGATPRTPLVDALHDIELVVEMVRAMPPRPQVAQDGTAGRELQLTHEGGWER
jgi:predicted dehydrogenase